jgi:hypothetical protein
VGIFREDYSGEVRTEDGQAALPLDEVDGEHMAGGSYPLSIWMAFMEAALEDEEVIEFPERPDGRPTPSPTDSPTESPTDDPTDDADEAEVPNVIGMGLNDAISTLSARGFGVGNVTGNGDVVASTNPQPGAMVREGTTVDIKVTSNEFAVPDVRGWAEADAVSHLRGLGLRVNVTYVSTDDYPGSCGIVVEQDPGPGATVRTGDNVKLNVPKDSEWGCSPGGGDEGGDGDGDEGGDEGGDGSESGGNGEGNGNGNNGN